MFCELRECGKDKSKTKILQAMMSGRDWERRGRTGISHFQCPLIPPNSPYGARGSTLLRFFHLSISSVRLDSRWLVTVLPLIFRCPVVGENTCWISTPPSSPDIFIHHHQPYSTTFPRTHRQHIFITHVFSTRPPWRRHPAVATRHCPPTRNFSERSYRTASKPPLPLFASDLLMRTHVWIWRARGMASLNPIDDFLT